MQHTHVLIIGGGLSGLHTAYECTKHGLDYCLIEARDRLGGRVLSCQADRLDYNANRAAFDLGPSWFWPGQQRILSLIDELGLTQQVFIQSGDGEAIYEDQQGNIQRGVNGISMSGAYRLKGGIRQLITALSSSLDEERVSLESSATSIRYNNGKVEACVQHGSSSKNISCNHAVLAMPPRVALANINFCPEFSDNRKLQLNDVATWMAGHAKLVCVYENKFWRESGLSGDVISHKGPLQEIHDASVDDEELNALFGFVGVSPVYRANRVDEIKKLAIAQLVRLFGEQANDPISVYFQDWSRERYTATKYDQEIQRFHTANNIGDVQESGWNEQLIWSGTEAAAYSMHNNGFLEGALEASMQAVSLIK